MKGFKAKTGKFGSLVSLIALSAMVVLFAANLPVFLDSTSGQIFAGLWGAFALVMCAAHIVRLSAQRERRVATLPLMTGLKDARTRKNLRMVRAMRG
ncbi:hypothetical protein [Sporomusa sp.]|uniref:hypothetical protein n=1 Tax=Sporomusa sp. TaxID=2078658 RepID=UPI002B812F93|nr:hypothetical protein [Sporomusa sp.]HWR43811.1 hypothetical protein [Sporomusa sp.]